MELTAFDSEIRGDFQFVSEVTPSTRSVFAN